MTIIVHWRETTTRETTSFLNARGLLGPTSESPYYLVQMPDGENVWIEPSAVQYIRKEHN